MGQYFISNIYVIGVPNGGEGKTFAQELFDVLVVNNFPKLINENKP